MPSEDEHQRLDHRRVLVGKIIHQLILRGWRPPRQMPDPALGNLLESIEFVGSRGETLNLSPGEVRTMLLTAEGWTAPQIAEKTHLGQETIKMQQKTARRKLGARNTTHAVAIAMRKGVIE